MLNEHKWQDELIHNIGLITGNLDWVVKDVVYHPLQFAKNRMEDETDERPIRVRYFASFVMKALKTKTTVRHWNYIFNNMKIYAPLIEEFGYSFENEEEYKHVLRKYFSGKRMKHIDDIYEKGLVLQQNI